MSTEKQLLHSPQSNLFIMRLSTLDSPAYLTLAATFSCFNGELAIWLWQVASIKWWEEKNNKHQI